MRDIVIVVMTILGVMLITFSYIHLECKNHRMEKYGPDFARVFGPLDRASPESVQKMIQAIEAGQVEGVTPSQIDAALKAARALKLLQ